MASNVLTSRDAELRLDGVAIAKARDVSLSLTADMNEDTALGQDSRTYVYGLRSYSGSCTLQYDRSSSSSTILQQALKKTNNEHSIELILIDRSVSGDVLFGQVGLSVTVGDIVQVSVSITFNTIDGNV
jgi:hypothetical protein